MAFLLYPFFFSSYALCVLKPLTLIATYKSFAHDAEKIYICLFNQIEKWKRREKKHEKQKKRNKKKKQQMIMDSIQYSAYTQFSSYTLKRIDMVCYSLFNEYFNFDFEKDFECARMVGMQN